MVGRVVAGRRGGYEREPSVQEEALPVIGCLRRPARGEGVQPHARTYRLHPFNPCGLPSGSDRSVRARELLGGLLLMGPHPSMRLVI